MAADSLRRRCSESIPVHSLVMGDLAKSGLYRRPTEVKDGRLWDRISGAFMATEHACARFLVPHLAREGWALFMDGDVLVLDDVAKLFDGLDPAYAVYCVKHDYRVSLGPKMDGQVNQAYPRKNWSSVFAINCGHEANRRLTLEVVNHWPGRTLHGFGWLGDHLIGALDPRWNYLVGEQERPAEVSIAHFTLGLPDMPGYESCDFADEWRAEQKVQDVAAA